MKIIGEVLYDPKDKIHYYISIEKLGIYTQGNTLENAYFMIKDAVSLMISDKYNIDFKIKYLKIITINTTSFYLKSSKREFKEFILSNDNFSN